MSIGDNSYSAVAEIEALVPMYTASGSFSASTRPTAAQVETLIDQVSGLLNALLAEAGFSIPVSQADAKLALDLFVAEEVADLCEAVNRSGRFYMGEKELRSRGRFRVIMADAKAFIEEHAEGLEQLGATRERDQSHGADYWSESDAGADLEPIFQTQGWMRQSITDWDTD